MNIDTETVQKIAHLARLEFHESDLENMKEDLGKILDFMKKLNELDTENVEPLIYMSKEMNILRSDREIQEISHEEALKNAPKRDSDYFRVPKVIDL
jgi:aspartyl-tRNA(Asn)/glutamyl-tRNA(Gln) amidotransferase subunit C